MTNHKAEHFLRFIISDLTRSRNYVRRRLPVNVIDSMELVCGQQYNLAKAEAAFASGWAADPVQPSTDVYAKMALNLLDLNASLPPNAKQPASNQYQLRLSLP
jgi:hypothetical protein